MKKRPDKFHHLTNHFLRFPTQNRTFLTRETYGSGSRNIRFPHEKHKKLRHTFSTAPMNFPINTRRKIWTSENTLTHHKIRQLQFISPVLLRFNHLIPLSFKKRSSGQTYFRCNFCDSIRNGHLFHFFNQLSSSEKTHQNFFNRI